MMLNKREIQVEWRKRGSEKSLMNEAKLLNRSERKVNF